MSKQSSSDPLPYVQVDRAVSPAVAHLASHMKVTTQHALGSLVGFWNLCGDPRELEAIVSATPMGEEPEVVLSADDVALRFQLAADARVEPVVLARLGILEERDAGCFRVRGMSRFFEPIARRIVARKAASTAGKASAVARKAATGSSQPVRADVRRTFDGRSTDVREPLNDARSVSEPEPERPPKTAVSGQRSSLKEEPETLARSAPQLELVSEKPRSRPTPKPPDPEAEFARFANSLTPDEGAIFEAYETHMGVRLGADWGLKKFIQQKLKTHHATELCAAIKGHAADPWRREHSPSLRAILRDASVIASSAKAGAA